MLPYEIREPATRDDARGIVVLLHGRGSNRFDLLSLAPHFGNRIVVAPEAPFPAAPWGYGPGSAWYRFLGRNRPEPESFSHSLEVLHEFLTALPAQLEVQNRTLVVGGFSQGGTMSMAYALAHPGAVSGVLNFSGFLADHALVKATPDTVRGTRFFWGHGRADSSIPFDLAIEGRALLQRAGADLEAHDYEIGHWIDPVELQDAISWLGR